MAFKLLHMTDKDRASKLFRYAYLCEDENYANYTEHEFETAWQKWISFFVIDNDGDPVAFCGIRDYGDYARIFDRYFVFPPYRNQGLRHAEHSLQLVQHLVDYTIQHNKIPFFSIQGAHKRNALIKAVNKFNGILNKDSQLHVLPDLYNTVGGSDEKETYWQNIAILKPFEINLPRRPLQ